MKNDPTFVPPRPPDVAPVYDLMANAKKAVFFLTYLPGVGGQKNIIEVAELLAEKESGPLVRGAISDPKAMPPPQNQMTARRRMFPSAKRFTTMTAGRTGHRRNCSGRGGEANSHAAVAARRLQPVPLVGAGGSDRLRAGRPSCSGWSSSIGCTASVPPTEADRSRPMAYRTRPRVDQNHWLQHTSAADPTSPPAPIRTVFGHVQNFQSSYAGSIPIARSTPGQNVETNTLLPGDHSTLGLWTFSAPKKEPSYPMCDGLGHGWRPLGLVSFHCVKRKRVILLTRSYHLLS